MPPGAYNFGGLVGLIRHLGVAVLLLLVALLLVIALWVTSSIKAEPDACADGPGHLHRDDYTKCEIVECFPCPTCGILRFVESGLTPADEANPYGSPE